MVTHTGAPAHTRLGAGCQATRRARNRLALILLLRGMHPILDPKCLQGRAGAQLGDPLPGDPRDETQTPKVLPGDTPVERRHTLGEADTPSIVLSVSVWCVLAGRHWLPRALRETGEDSGRGRVCRQSPRYEILIWSPLLH